MLLCLLLEMVLIVAMLFRKCVTSKYLKIKAGTTLKRDIGILGLFLLPLILVKGCKIVQAYGHIRMVRAEHFFSNGQRAPVKWLRLGILALVLVEGSQVVEAGG